MLLSGAGKIVFSVMKTVSTVLLQEIPELAVLYINLQ